MCGVIYSLIVCVRVSERARMSVCESERARMSVCVCLRVSKLERVCVREVFVMYPY